MANLSSKTGFTPNLTQISLANNAATTIQNMSAYDGQMLTGFVYVDATTDKRAFCVVQVIKNGAGTYEVAAADVSGDDEGGSPIVTFAMSGNNLQATLPNFAGFTSAYIRFKLDAPALGAQFPLQVSSSNISYATSVNVVSNANYTITTSDGYETIDLTTGASDRTITLPASANSAGRKITIKKLDSGTGKVLIARAGSDLIDGITSYILGFQYQSVTLVCSGANWLVINQPSLFYYHNNDYGGSGQTATAEVGYYSVIAPYTAYYHISGVMQVYTGTSIGNVSSGQVRIKTGSATYASATLRTGSNVVQPYNGAGNRGIVIAIAFWTGIVNAGDTIHYGIEQLDSVGVGGHAQHGFTVQEVRR